MKKFILSAFVLFSMTSCASMFTAARQSVTFVGQEGTRIYDNGQKIATIDESGEARVRMRKKIMAKELVAKKDGYKSATLVMEPQFNPVSCLNLLNVLAWGIDLATQKVCKWDTTYFEIELEAKEQEAKGQ